ncbi:MAG: MBL fold metallo-hydrolase [Fuerstiella sp.]
MRRHSGLLSFIFVMLSLLQPVLADDYTKSPSNPYTLVLGIAQDAGFPQAGCQKECCREAWGQPQLRRFATSLAIVDPVSQERWLLDCTPDFRDQLRLLDEIVASRAVKEGSALSSVNNASRSAVAGIFLTHAHIGHYAGLIHLGREVMGTDAIPVYGMPRMNAFLTDNGPWSQLVTLKNIALNPLTADVAVRLNDRLSVTPFLVPHRDEFSETVGFRIQGPNRSVVFIPDIDKWEKWDRRIEDLIADSDIAYLDGTFFGNGEIPGRDMSLIPHPFIEESLQRFGKLAADVRGRVRFIHLNHTNPALHNDSAACRLIISSGCNVAVQGEVQGL